MEEEGCSETPRGFQSRKSYSEIPREFQEDEGVPSTSYDVCEHSATQSDLQCCPIPTFLLRERGEEEGMIEKEIPPLFFQTLKDIQENFKEVEGVENCTSTGTTLEEQPSCSMVEDYTVAE